MNTKTQSQLYRKELINQIKLLPTLGGFKTKGPNLIRESGDSVQILNVQSSQSTTKDLLVVTVNIGLFYKELALRMEDPPMPRNVVDCHWWTRIGYYTEAAADKWWSIASEGDLISASEEVCTVLRERVIPEMDNISSREGICALWKLGSTPGTLEADRKMYMATLCSS